MFLNLDRRRGVLSTFFSGVPDAPADEKNYGRLDAAWFDTAGIRPFGPPAAFDFNDTIWQTRTGNFSAKNMPAPAISNSPFRLVSTETYDFILEAIAGDDGAKQQVTARSSLWEGERFYIRSADELTDITTVPWRELETFYSQLDRGPTTDPVFTTIMTHPLDDDTVEQMTVQIAGVQVTGGSGRATFGLVITAQNIAGVTTILGATVLFQHKTIGLLAAQAVDDGSANVLVQVRGTVDDWDWRAEMHFDEIRA